MVYLNTFNTLIGLPFNVLKLPIRHFTARRALLYVPGNDSRKLNKAFNSNVDCIAMDLEDGVAAAARANIKEILNLGKPKSERKFDWSVRVNSIESGLCETDLKEILTSNYLPETILLPKVQSAEHLKWFSNQLDRNIKQNTKIGLIVLIESAKAIINLKDICTTAWTLSQDGKFSPCSLVFGSDDFCADIGITRTENSNEILYARQKTVLYAKAFHLQAIDMVYINYKDLEGLQRQSVEGARMGFTGKQVIHPDQIPVVQAAFMPNEQQIEWATGLLRAFEEHQRSGKGAFVYKETMIDMPTMKQAKNLMDLITSIKH